MATQTTRQNGPPLLIPALIMAALTLTSAALGATAARFDAPDLLAYDLAHHTTILVLGTVVFGTSIPLLIWSATVYRRLHRLGVTAPGSAIAFGGGLLAAASLAVSGLLTWTTAQNPDPSSPGLARALTAFAFATGGPGFVVPLAMLIAGVSVPSLILRLLPRALALTGLVIAALSALATFALLLPALDFLIPVGRFGGLLWLIAASVLLPLNRHRNPTPQPANAMEMS
ncbi:MAG TPA: DUF4386 domain-containing protein [Pseudonocardiaceae bacterium]|jgi:hypothetical protein|nr:DUF4386 domain-containing protein [Pseudonocardiaceae bacterium]